MIHLGTNINAILSLGVVSALVVLVLTISVVVSGGGALVEDAGVVIDVHLTIKQVMIVFN